MVHWSHFPQAPTAELPLAGLRVAIEDVIDVAGFRTGASNRAFQNFYPAKNTSATVVGLLIKLGAIVVGKTKTTQFALGEEPTADWVDELCPFNPRGDGYQTPEGSSAGSAVAVAAYDWLDLALGTDSKYKRRNSGIYRQLMISSNRERSPPGSILGGLWISTHNRQLKSGWSGACQPVSRRNLAA